MSVRAAIGGRTAMVAVLVSGALAAVLIGWYRAGMREVVQEEAAMVEAARRDAQARAAEHAQALAAKLEALRHAESARPYFHYQNLFHDPAGASEGLSVVSSPLASGPADPLIAVHFQIDERGAVTSPSVNDAAPEAVQSKSLDRDRGGLAAVAGARLALAAVAEGGEIAVAVGPRVATAEPRRPDPITRRPVTRPAPAPEVRIPTELLAARPEVEHANVEQQQAILEDPETQVVALPQAAYAQNNFSNEIFNANRARAQQQAFDPSQLTQRIEEPDVQRASPPPQAAQPANPPPANPPAAATTTPTPPAAPPAPAPRPRRRRAPTPPPAPAPVIVTVSPLTWHTVPIGGEPTLVAVRRVVTPDGARTQGLTVGRAQLAEWLADRGDTGAALAGEGEGAAVGIGGAPWTVRVDDHDALAYARSTGAVFREGFLVRFVPIAGVAMLCGALVVLVTARAERLARQRARFAAAAAHELRTPLAGIQLYGDMLGEQLGDPGKQRDYASRISLEAARLGRVVANVLGVSQLERGGLAVRTEAGDVVDAVREAVDRAEPGLVRAGATVELAAPASLPARFDRDAVARIVGNLLDNAEKYGRESADRHITVTVASTGDGGAVEIAVRDRGPGLPAKLRRGRFEAFRRAAGDDAPPGLGLGLALSQALAQAMGGSLAPRAVSPGAELVLRLPAA